MQQRLCYLVVTLWYRKLGHLSRVVIIGIFATLPFVAVSRILNKGRFEPRYSYLLAYRPICGYITYTVVFPDTVI